MRRTTTNELARARDMRRRGVTLEEIGRQLRRSKSWAAKVLAAPKRGPAPAAPAAPAPPVPPAEVELEDEPFVPTAAHEEWLAGRMAAHDEARAAEGYPRRPLAALSAAVVHLGYEQGESLLLDLEVLSGTVDARQAQLEAEDDDEPAEVTS